MRVKSLIEKIEEARKELLDLSMRNPLLNYRSLRARGVGMVGESSDQVFHTLVAKGKPMSFLSVPSSEGVQAEWNEEDGFFGGQPEDADTSSIAADQSDLRLQTAETSENLQKRLLTTYRLANTSVEETGVNTLFMAFGMLHWYEADQSQEERRAPLILVPVQLERAGALENFRVTWTGEDIGANLSLIEKVRADFGIALPGQDQADEVAEEDASLADYLDSAEYCIRQSSHRRWRIDRDSVILGFFSYNKLRMFEDLDSDTWPEGDGLAENEVMTALFNEGFHEPASHVPEDARLDDHLTPGDTYHVVDADSSQSLAICDAAGGRNLVIQGPPGTGKSQTITNIIADAVARGKRVLFVSEKMAALEVVKRRLDNVGLGRACLELHSHKTNKRALLDELNRILNPTDRRIQVATGASLGPEEMANTINRLNAYTDAVNTPVAESGVTPNDAFGQLLTNNGCDAPNPVRWSLIDSIGEWSDADFRRKREVVEELRSRLQRTGVPQEHPFWGTGLRALLPAAQARLREKIEAVTKSMEALTGSSAALAEGLIVVPPRDIVQVFTVLGIAEDVAAAPEAYYALGPDLNLAVGQWRSYSKQIRGLLDVGFRWLQLHEEYDHLLQADGWLADLTKVREDLNKSGRSFFKRRLSGSYKRARKQLAAVLSGELPRGLDSQIALIDAICEEQQLRRDLSYESGGKYPHAAYVLGSHWAGPHTDWETVASAVRWWLDLQDMALDGRVSEDAVRILQYGPDSDESFTRRFPSDSRRGDGLTSAIGEVRRAVDNYRDCSQELSSTLEMDNVVRFGHSDGVTTGAFSESRRVLEAWAERLADIQDLVGFNASVDVALSEGLRPVIAVAEQHPDAAASLTAWFDQAWYESVSERAFVTRPELRGFDGAVHASRVQRFRTIDKESLGRNSARVSSSHHTGVLRLGELPERLPRRLIGDDDDSETVEVRRRVEQLRVLRREIEKKSRHKPIRRLLREAGDVIQDLKPVFMMSPLSIANYIEPGAARFDMVIFDEASQVRPVDALGALMRGRKAVVVGDSRQLPPTTFFERMGQSDEDAADEDESVIADIESILGLFSSQGAPSRELRWHYRSRHESLIAVSNREFYNNNLLVFSSPDVGREALGLRFRHLPGATFDRGRSGTNRLEAEAVANAVMKHAVHNPDRSLGVAAFSVRQAQEIQEQLEVRRRRDDSAEGFFASHPDEPFFVKNLENVQGDERDVIFISVGYGRDDTGQVSMNFGPLNQQGGERRLNVLITRAKEQCHVFTNLRADDLDLSRTGSVGVRALKTFLAYAETGDMPKDIPQESDRDVDSPFQQMVAQRLRDHGYNVHEEVASGGKFVDIGVIDPERPGRYLIGIECDGASYHSARSARDRDRLREEVLRGLGWELHRIWSTDWFRNPERELQRTIEAIERAKAAGR